MLLLEPLELRHLCLDIVGMKELGGHLLQVELNDEVVPAAEPIRHRSVGLAPGHPVRHCCRVRFLSNPFLQLIIWTLYYS